MSRYTFASGGPQKRPWLQRTSTCPSTTRLDARRPVAARRRSSRPSAARPARASTSKARSSKCRRQSHGVAMRKRSEPLRRRAEHEVGRAADAQQPPQHRLAPRCRSRRASARADSVGDAVDERRVSASPSPGHAPPRSNECAIARRWSAVSAATSVGQRRASTVGADVGVERGVLGRRDLAANQSPPARWPWPPLSTRSKRCSGDAFTTMRDRYLQLTRYTWSTRRSAGTTSSPGARCGALPLDEHRRPPAQRVARAARNACPFMNDATNRSRCAPSFHARCSRSKSSASTFSIAGGSVLERWLDVVGAAACRAR